MLSREQAFGQLRRNLELTGLQEQTVATRQRNVREAVAAQLKVTDAFPTGSYRRHTLIGPLRRADVDVMAVLDRSYRARGPRAVLDLVRDVLLAEYTRTPKISRNGQAVTITFSDFVIDVVPAFRLPWWSWNEGWEICDSSRETWITTNPAKHVDISARANKAHSGDLVPRIKQLKAWNRTVGEPLRSFHLEALAWSVFGTPAFGRAPASRLSIRPTRLSLRSRSSAAWDLTRWSSSSPPTAGASPSRSGSVVSHQPHDGSWGTSGVTGPQTRSPGARCLRQRPHLARTSLAPCSRRSSWAPSTSWSTR